MKIDIFVNKYVTYALYAFLLVSLAVNFRSCGVSSNVNKLKREVKSLSVEVDSLRGNIYTKEELDTRIAIEGYEISKRMLYDQNAIVRTVMRPDDRMAEYDQKIKDLHAKLK